MSNFPYPGLRPFRRDESDIFFGRDEQIDQLLEKLGRACFLAVVGPSGCGKSSLIRAGMIPALETGFLSSAGARWRVADMRPGNRPLRNLAEALLNESALGPERAKNKDALPFLLSTLRRGPLGLVEVLEETPLPERTNLLLLVDQFEEIFRYRKQFSSDEADAFVALLLATAHNKVPVYVVITMRSDFLGDCALFTSLPESINDSQFLTPRLTREQIRSAVVGPAEMSSGKIEPVLVNRILNDMGTDPDQLPLMQHALMRMWTRATQCNSVSGESANIANNTTAEVFLTLADYETIGGLTKALSNHADEAYNELNVEQKRVSEVMFRALSERGTGQRDTRRLVRLSRIAEIAGVPISLIPWRLYSVVEVFRRTDRSFITPPAGISLNPDTILDISHESLIRQWDRLKEWVKQEAASAEIYHRLKETALLWKDKKAALWGTPDLENALDWKKQEKPTSEWAERYGSKPDFNLAMEFLRASEQKREEERQQEEKESQEKLKQAQELAESKGRTAKYLFWFSVGMFIALLGAGLLWREAVTAKNELTITKSNLIIKNDELTKSKNKLTKALNNAKRAKTNANKAENLALTQNGTIQRLLNDTNKIIPVLGNLTSGNPTEKSSALSELKALAENGQISQEFLPAIKQIIEKNAPRYKETSKVIEAIKSNSPTIYIQIADEGQRIKAKGIQTKLRETEYTVPGIENVRGKAKIPSKTELRYFRENEKDEANKIADVLKNLNVDVEPKYVRGFEDSKVVKPKTYELWFSTDSLPPSRVYIKTQNERQNSFAEKAKTELQGKGLGVPSIEVSEGPPSTTELGYFRRIEQNEAESLVSNLKILGLKDVEAKYIPGFESSGAKGLGYYELWFSVKAVELPNPVTAITPPTPAPKLLPYIYIKIGNELQREKANKIKAKLQEKGFGVAPDIEIVGSRAPKKTQVKYFNSFDVNEAEQIENIIEKLTEEDISTKRSRKEMESRHYELWLSGVPQQ